MTTTEPVSRSLGVSVVVVSLYLLGSALWAQPAPTAQGDDWVLSVRRAPQHKMQPEQTEGFWIGLTNLAPEARVVCVVDILWELIDATHGESGGVEGFESHMAPGTCSHPSIANLVLSGETLFLYGGVPVPEWAEENAAGHLTASLVDYKTRKWTLLRTGIRLRVVE